MAAARHPDRIGSNSLTGSGMRPSLDWREKRRLEQAKVVGRSPVLARNLKSQARLVHQRPLAVMDILRIGRR